MSGKELKEKLRETGLSQAEIARRLGVIPESFNQSLTAADIKTGFLEKLCQVLGKDMSFFYDSATHESEELVRLREENRRLRADLELYKDPTMPDKASEIYEVWMEYMRFNERMQKLYQKQIES